MLNDVGTYSGLLCAGMHDKVDAFINGPNAERDLSSGTTQKKMLRDQSERGMELNMVFLTYHLRNNDNWMKMMS